MNPIRVPILRIPFSEDDREFLRRGMDQILSSGTLTAGPFTERFEQAFARFSGARHAVACANATAGLEIILRALDIQGHSVIVPTNTFLATALAVIHSGNRVIFADSDPNTLSLDVADVERRLAPDTAAVITVHVGGVISPDVETLKRICDRRGIALIEDCAHAHGSRLNGRHAGTLGVAGAFSFFPTKVLVTGEGGMIATDDESLASRARMIRNHGKNPALQNRMSEMGNNFRISEFTALLGVQQTERADSLVARRRAVAAFYDKALHDIPGLRTLKLPPELSSSYYKYVAYLDEGIDRAKLKSTLKERWNVTLTGEVYADLCHTEPVWRKHTLCGRLRSRGEVCPDHPAGECAEIPSEFPGAERLSQRHVCLPLYPDLTEEELRHVVDSLEEALSQASKGASCARS